MLGYLSQTYPRPRVVMRRRQNPQYPQQPPSIPVPPPVPQYGHAPRKKVSMYPPPPPPPVPISRSSFTLKPTAHVNRQEYVEQPDVTQIVTALCDSITQWQQATDAHLRSMKQDIDWIKSELSR